MVANKKVIADVFIGNHKFVKGQCDCIIDSMGKIGYVRIDKYRTLIDEIISEEHVTDPNTIAKLRTYNLQQLVDRSGCLLVTTDQVYRPSRGTTLLQRHCLQDIKAAGLIDCDTAGLAYINYV